MHLIPLVSLRLPQLPPLFCFLPFYIFPDERDKLERVNVVVIRFFFIVFTPSFMFSHPRSSFPFLFNSLGRAGLRRKRSSRVRPSPHRQAAIKLCGRIISCGSLEGKRSHRVCAMLEYQLFPLRALEKCEAKVGIPGIRRLFRSHCVFFFKFGRVTVP
jgi:hypothetical protein